MTQSLRWLAGFFLLFFSGISAQQETDPKTGSAKEGTRKTSQSKEDGKNWTMFRGDPLGTGNSDTRLADKPELLWTFKVPKGAFESTAAIVEGVVYISDLDGKVYALDLKTGNKRWEFKVDSGFSASPSVRDELIFVGDYDGTFYCLDKQGKLKWKHATEAEISSSANFYRDNVLFGCQDATLYCLNMKTGKTVWSYQVEDQIRCSPTVVEGRCFVAGCDARFHIVDLKKGKGLTAVDIDGPTMVTPAVVGDNAYFGTEQGTAFSINWKEAKKNWDARIDERGDSIRSSPAITKIQSKTAMVFGTRSKHIYAVELEKGHVLWKYKTRSMVDSSAAVAGGRVFFGTDRGKLIALNTEDGKLSWETDLGGTITASPAIADGKLVIANDRGTVFCFGKKE
ncbi:MAG: PQQ-binding-like beta-propeller repeat protein [Planctomycetota bacterium]|nr:PQQ-binding-like beta-propeller repeat protein [Planctomycetota bacterium]